MNLCFIFLKTTTRFKLLKDLLSLMINVFLCCPCLSFRLSRSDMKCNAEMSHVDHSHQLYPHEAITISSFQGIQMSLVRDNNNQQSPCLSKERTLYWNTERRVFHDRRSRAYSRHCSPGTF